MLGLLSCDGFAPESGGGEIVNGHLIRALERAGFASAVLAAQPSPIAHDASTAVPFVRVAGVRVANPFAIATYLIRKKPKLVVLSGPSVNNVAAFVGATIVGANVVAFYHADIDWQSVPGRVLAPLFFRWLLPHCAVVITTTTSLARMLAARGVASTRVVRLATDDPLQASDGARRDAIAFVGGLGRSHNYKRLDLLLRALGDRKLAALHLDVIGGGDPTPFLALATALGVERRVTMHGRVSDERRRAIVGSARAFVMPSPTAREGFSLATLDAMQCGTPAITGEYAGGAELVRATGFGATWVGEDPAQLASAIASVVAWSDRERAFRGERYATLAPSFTWTSVEDDLASIFMDAIR